MLHKFARQRRKKKYIPRYTSFTTFVTQFKKGFKKRRFKKKKKIKISKRYVFLTRLKKFRRRSFGLKRFIPRFLKYRFRKQWPRLIYIKTKFLINRLMHWYGRQCYYFCYKLKKRNKRKPRKGRLRWGRKTFLRKRLWATKTLFNLITFHRFFKRFNVKSKNAKYRRYLLHYFVRRRKILRLAQLANLKLKLCRRRLFRQYRCYSLNLLTTKTNTFITITTFFGGSILFSITPRRLDPKVYFDTKKRTTWAAEAVMRRTVQWLIKRAKLEPRRRVNRSLNRKFVRTQRKSIFFVNLYGPKIWLHKRMCKLLFNNTAKFSSFVQIRYKQAVPHNGCPFQIRKRKKNKGWNKWTKRRKRGKVGF